MELLRQLRTAAVNLVERSGCLWSEVIEMGACLMGKLNESQIDVPSR
jgi:hypothetical protein